MDITGIGSILDFGGKLIDRIWPDPTEAAKMKVAMYQAEKAGELAELNAAWDNAKAQLEVNKVEAGHESLFVSGWRPFIGWVCGVAFAYKFILAPLIAFILAIFGHDVKLPEIAFDEMLTVLLGMLGLGAMRSFEKVRPTRSTPQSAKAVGKGG